MSLTLSDMDDFTLEELDNFTLQELDNMSSYSELLAAVKEKCSIADKLCDKDAVLSESQIQMVKDIVHAQMEERESKPPTLAKTITTKLAINTILKFLVYCTGILVDHLPEIEEQLRKAYLLLEELIQQAT